MSKDNEFIIIIFVFSSPINQFLLLCVFVFFFFLISFNDMTSYESFIPENIESTFLLSPSRSTPSRSFHSLHSTSDLSLRYISPVYPISNEYIWMFITSQEKYCNDLLTGSPASPFCPPHR